MLLRSLRPDQCPAFDLISTADHLLVLLDYDGTLSPLTSDPSAAAILPEARESLERLERTPCVTAGVLSGRSLTDLVPRVGVPGIVYGGNHGNEIRGRGLDFVEPCAVSSMPFLRAALSLLAGQLDGMPHIRIQDKGMTATIRTKGANEEERRKAAHLVRRLLPERFQVVDARDELEIVPYNRWNKGTAAKWIRAKLGLERSLVIFAGDDVSDEEAFRELPGEVTVKVGGGPTAASYAAESPHAVAEFLALLTTRPGRLATCPH